MKKKIKGDFTWNSSAVKLTSLANLKWRMIWVTLLSSTACPGRYMFKPSLFNFRAKVSRKEMDGSCHPRHGLARNNVKPIRCHLVLGSAILSYEKGVFSGVRVSVICLVLRNELLPCPQVQDFKCKKCKSLIFASFLSLKYRSSLAPQIWSKTVRRSHTVNY